MFLNLCPLNSRAIAHGIVLLQKPMHVWIMIMHEECERNKNLGIQTEQIRKRTLYGTFVKDEKYQSSF